MNNFYSKLKYLLQGNDDLPSLIGDEKRIVTINALYNMATTLSQVFVNVYLYEYTGSLVVMSIYTIIRIGLFPLAFAFGGKVSHKIKFSYIITTGLLFIISSLAFVLWRSDIIAIYNDAVYIVASLTGIGEGLFWFSINSCHQIVPRIHIRSLYLAQIGIFNNITALAAPIISSLIIKYSGSDTVGYIHIFQFVIVIYIAIVGISFRFRVKSEKKLFPLSKVYSLKDQNWRLSMIAVFFYGIRDSFTLTLSGLLIYNATGSSGSLYSQLLIVFSLLAILSFHLLAKRLNNDNFLIFFITGTVLTVVASLVLVYFNNIYGAVFFGIANAVSSAFYGNPYTELLMRSISTFSNDSQVARVIAKETYLSFGRCFGMALIVVFYYFIPQNDMYLYVSVTLCSLCPLIVFFYINKLVKVMNLLN